MVCPVDTSTWTQESFFLKGSDNPQFGTINPLATHFLMETSYAINGTVEVVGSAKCFDKFPSRVVPGNSSGRYELRPISTIAAPSRMVMVFEGAAFPTSDSL